MRSTHSYHAKCLLVIVLAFGGLNVCQCSDASDAAEASTNSIVRSCVAFAKFLCLDLTGTNHVETSAVQTRKVGGVPFEVSTVTLGDYEFWVENSGVMRFFFAKESLGFDENHASCAKPPSAQGIRDFLCPNVNFANRALVSRKPWRTYVWYGWVREEAGILVEDESVYLQIDEKTQRCMHVQNSVKQGKLSLSVPARFDQRLWAQKTKDYVAERWWLIARQDLAVDPADFRAEPSEREIQYVYRTDGVLVCRFPFVIKQLHTPPSWPAGWRSDVDGSEYWVDVNVATGKIERRGHAGGLGDQGEHNH